MFRNILALLLPTALLLADPILQVDRLHHAFGEIPPTAKVHASFQVTNAGDGVLRILRVLPSCDCTTASVTGPVFLKAQESTTVEMIFDPVKDKGPIERSILVVSDAPRNPKAELVYDADVVFPVMASEEAVFFPDTLGSDRDVREVRIRSTVDRDLDLVLKSGLPPFLQVTLESTQRVGKVRIRMDGSKLPREGASNGKLVIATGIPELPELPIEYYSYPGHAVAAQPEGLAFDPALRGKPQAYTVKLMEIRKRPFKVVGLPKVEAPFRVRLLTRGRATEHALKVSLGAQVKAGTYTGTVHLKVEDPDQSEVAIPVTARMEPSHP